MRKYLLLLLRFKKPIFYAIMIYRFNSTYELGILRFIFASATWIKTKIDIPINLIILSKVYYVVVLFYLINWTVYKGHRKALIIWGAFNALKISASLKVVDNERTYNEDPMAIFWLFIIESGPCIRMSKRRWFRVLCIKGLHQR